MGPSTNSTPGHSLLLARRPPASIWSSGRRSGSGARDTGRSDTEEEGNLLLTSADSRRQFNMDTALWCQLCGVQDLNLFTQTHLFSFLFYPKVMSNVYSTAVIMGSWGGQCRKKKTSLVIIVVEVWPLAFTVIALAQKRRTLMKFRTKVIFHTLHWFKGILKANRFLALKLFSRP